MDHLLIDSDVLLDVFFDREPFSHSSAKVLELCDKRMVKCYITPLIIANTYYFLRKKTSHDLVIERLKRLMIGIEIIAMDKKSVFEAINSNFTDFEDALENFSAERQGKISTIITRNIKDYKKSKLAVMTPQNYLMR